MELRKIALYVSRVRVGFGLTMLASPKLAFGPIYGREVGEPGAAAIGRMMGAREALLGAGAAIAVAEGPEGANWVSMIAVVDGLDAVVNLASPRLGWRRKVMGLAALASSVAHLMLAKKLARETAA